MNFFRVLLNVFPVEPFSALEEETFVNPEVTPMVEDELRNDA